jgi:hypothetical protein
VPASSSPRPRRAVAAPGPSVAGPSVAAMSVAARSVAAMSVAIAAACVLAGCGTPPELQPPGTPVPQPTTQPSPTGSPSLLPTGVPSDGGLAEPTASGSLAPSFAEGYAASCNGYPSGSQVIALLRRTGGLLPSTGTVTVTSGPLCAGTWQYTVLAVPNHEPMAVVTKGTPGQLELVTAGTDVCSIPVRTGAPAGILTAALCPPPGST